MTRDQIRDLLQGFRRGELSEDHILEELARLPFRVLGDARVDTHRALRQGFPEVVLGLGKSAEQISRIVSELRRDGGDVLVTRVEPDVARAVRAEHPELAYHAPARLLALRQSPAPGGARARGGEARQSDLRPIAVVTAGTADVPVAEEAAVTAELLGLKVERLYDVGVAGLHRLLASIDVLRAADVAIVVAGMEGALPSVVAGLLDRPVIAVPTSIGYGASFGGLTALLGMLNSCAPNVATVNVDNGFGAAFLAALIQRV